jgi:CBS domain containing-hemolysin-like protein
MRETLGTVLLILANGVFAMAEIAVVSARKARLAQQAKARRASGDLCRRGTRDGASGIPPR